MTRRSCSATVLLANFRHECVYTVSARASGGPEGAFAVWDSGDLEIRFANESADSSDLRGLDILDYWGSGQITTGSLLEASRIAGFVTIDGVAAEGLTVTLSSGEVATTGAEGGYAISGVPLGAYRVPISGQPGDVVFPTTAQVAVRVAPDKVVSVNFGGTRIPASALIGSATSGAADFGGPG